MNTNLLVRLRIGISELLGASFLFGAGAFSAHAVTFTNNARLEITDPTGGLSWNSANPDLTVQCWLKLAVPSGVSLSENMTLLVNRRSGSETDAHAYQLRYNIYSGNLEFTSKGTSGGYTNTVIERPYLERWYHVAVVRQGEVFTAYVDGRQAFNSTANVGDARSTDGVCVGAWGSSKWFYGEVQELSIYQTPLSQDFIVQHMFSEQPAMPDLKGYFKLGYAVDPAASLTNSAPTPVPTGTESAVKQGAGNVAFEEANEAGEQSAFDTRRNGGMSALVPLSGCFAWEQVAFARPTPGIAFDFRFGYSSANAYGGFKLGGTDPYGAGPLGKGWRHTFETRVIPAQTFSPLADTDTLGLLMWNGAIVTWDLDYGVGEYRTRDKEYRGELLITTTNCQWTTPERLVYVFKRPDTGPAVMRGRLMSIRDFNANAVQVRWNETSGVITQVVDTVNGAYSFRYSGNLLTNVSFSQWQVNFAYDATNRLVSKSITNTSGIYATVNTAWQFFYNSASGLLERILDPRANTNVFVIYDTYGRKISEADGLGRTTLTEYNVPANRQMRHTDPGGLKWIETYDRKGRVLGQQDPLTNITSYAYDDCGNRISITDPLGYTTFFGYDSRANVIARTNALGEATAWVMHSFFNKAVQETDALGWVNYYEYDVSGNVTNHHDGLGSLVRYTYRTNGLVETATDGNGNLTRFRYNSDGFLISKTDPATNTTSFMLNEVGWKLAETNALGQVSFMAYDINGNVMQLTDPLARVYAKTYDPNGNVTSQSDAKGQITRYSYDAEDQKVAMTNRDASVWAFTYTARGKLERTIAPFGITTTNAYDAANRLVSIFDPAGNTISNIFDANGNAVAMIDKAGQRWSKTYDRLNRVIAEADPLGDAKYTSYDTVGRIKQITTPKGYPSTHFYDGRGRLTNWVDAEGYEWKYTYDGNANILDIEDALHGHYVMTYGPRNERTLERNQDNFEWRYTYDELMRLRMQRDPNGTTRTLEYDAGGRPLSVIFSTGRINSFAYDENNNAEVLSRSGSGPPTLSQLQYDSMDRVTQYTDAFGKRVRYGYDALGRIATLAYPDGKVLTNRYDLLSQLTNQVDWAGRQMAYTYDKAGRLATRTYPNGIMQSNLFDSAGQITNLTYSTFNPQPSSFNIALSYAYDRNGNKVGATEKGTLDWPMPSRRDETARYTASGRLIEREITTAASPQPSTLNYAYDPSGNMTNASGGGQSYAFTYDEDNRVTSVAWDCGISSQINTNRYDAWGRRISRTKDRIETRYVLDLAGKMERILCDMNGSGAISAWYVHGPDLCYKVDATNGLTCYHADAMANIIATTDGATNSVAKYAYTPYGRSLGSTNFQVSGPGIQPFTFVGSQGVMEELPGLYFMRARYYSAEAALFISSDPVKQIGPGWKTLLHTYAKGNPLSFIDPKGEAWFATRSLNYPVLGIYNILTRLLGAGVVNAGLYHEQLFFETPQHGRNNTGFNRIKGQLYGDESPNEPTDGYIGKSKHDKYDDEKMWQAADDVGFKFAYSLISADLAALISSLPDGEQILAMLQVFGYYVPGGINCQDWADKVRARYRELMSNEAPDDSSSGSNSGTTKSPNSSRTEGFVIAAEHAGAVNLISATTGITVANWGGSTSSSTESTLIESSGNNSFWKTTQSILTKALNTVTTKVKAAAATAKQSITKAVSSFVSKLFGGGKKK